MFLKVGTLKTYSSLAVFVTTKRPLSAGGRMSAPGFSTTPNGAYIPPPRLMPLWQLAQPRSMKSVKPSFCVPESAVASHGRPDTQEPSCGTPFKALASRTRHPHCWNDAPACQFKGPTLCSLRTIKPTLPPIPSSSPFRGVVHETVEISLAYVCGTAVGCSASERSRCCPWLGFGEKMVLALPCRFARSEPCKCRCTTIRHYCSISKLRSRRIDLFFA